MIACPRCGLSHKPSVEVCDCGYDLTALRRDRQARSGGADVRQSAYGWLTLWRSLIKVGALLQLGGGGWLVLVSFMNEQPLTALVVALLTGLGLVSSVAASKGIALLLYLDERQSQMQRELAELRRQQP